MQCELSLRYFDGFGREVQRKGLVEPGPVGSVSGEVSPRWLTTGWTIFNNKGKPVRQYEPFFDDSSVFRPRHLVGVSSVLLHDATERVVAIASRGSHLGKGRFGPWREESWDVNDTVLVPDPAADADVGALVGRLPPTEYLPTWHARREGGALGPEERAAADKAAAHAATPQVTYADSLGRAFLTVSHNRFERGGSMVEETYSTRVILDIEGNQREVLDANDRVVVHYDYDMLGSRVHQASMDAGERWTLLDVAGQPIYAWDSRGHRSRHTFDALRRPSEHFVRAGTAPQRLAVHTVYGESLASPEARNLRGRIVRIFDDSRPAQP